MAAERNVWRALRRLRLAARVSLWFERAWVGIWPALGVIGGFLCAALLGVPEFLPGAAHIAALAAVVGAVGWLIWRARGGLLWPAEDDADRRLERQSGLSHRPLSVLRDQPASVGVGDLWARHQARALTQVRRLRVGWPHPALAARDPRALRLLLLLGLTIGVVVAGPDASDRLMRALAPRFLPAAVIPELEIRAWVAPPAFTGLPPILLPAGGRIEAPQGSVVTIGLTGGSGGAPSLIAEGAERGFDAMGTGSFQAQARLERDGALVVHRDGAQVARWTVVVKPDAPPTVAWVHPPAAARGRVPQTKFSWRASHEYGVASLSAELRLRDRPGGTVLQVPIPLPGARPRDAAGTATQDLTANPWAGLPVTAALVGRDGAGLAGTSEPAQFVLPERLFRHPGAKAIIGVRKMLALDPQSGAPAAEALRQFADRAELWPAGDPAPDALRAIAATLDAPALKPAAVDAEQEKLWELALRLEEGTPTRTADALRRAQQDLHAALDPSAPAAAKEKAEIERRAEALERALQRHEEALADQAKRDPGSVTPIPKADQQAAEQALQQLRDAAKSDRMDQARQEMSELDRMLDKMRQASRGEAQRKRAEGRQKGREQMGVLQDVIRRQAGEIDHAESRLADAGSAADRTPARARDRAVQLALRRVLGELMQQHGDLTGSVPKNLGDADAAMRESAQALADDRDETASAASLRAVEALQQGGQEMSEQLAQKFGSPRQGQGDQGGQGDGQQDGDGDQMADAQDGSGSGDGMGDGFGDGFADGDRGPGESASLGPDGQPLGRQRDPFGRATREGIMGAYGGQDTRIPEEMERARGRAVQDELRRREAQRTRPQSELDYIDRLLKQD